MDYIRFPYLFNLNFKINPIAFTIGNIEVHWYGLIIAAAFLTATVLAFRNCEKRGIKTDDLIDYIIFALPSAIVGARLYYVIFSGNSDYWSNPLTILYVWEGGLAIYGAIIGLMISSFFVARHKKQKLLPIFDFALPYIMLAQAIGRWGNFVNQEAFGSNTANIFAMTGNRIKTYLYYMQSQGGNVQPELGVHPTFLYESIWCVLGFILLMYFYKNLKKRDGEILFLYMIVYGTGRFLIEGLRTDSLIAFGLRVSQILSALMVLAGIALLVAGRIALKKREAAPAEGAIEEAEAGDEAEEEDAGDNGKQD